MNWDLKGRGRVISNSVSLGHGDLTSVGCFHLAQCCCVLDAVQRGCRQMVRQKSQKNKRRKQKATDSRACIPVVQVALPMTGHRSSADP